MFRPKAVTPVRMEQLCLLWEYNDDDAKNYDDDRIMTIMLIDLKKKYHLVNSRLWHLAELFNSSDCLWYRTGKA